MKETGYVYILTNPSFKDEIVKIGITSGTVEKRMKELHTTGVPLPFEEYASYKTTKYAEVERFMHRSLSLLADNRVNSSREFFKIKPDVALDYLMQIAELLGEGEVKSCVQAAEIAKKEIAKRQAYQDKEEWLVENNRLALRDVIDKLTSIGLGYHLGTSDLRLDYTLKKAPKAYNCLMLLGKREYASFQPSELYKLAEACGKEPVIVNELLEKLRPYLISNQKHTPYELLTGYYNIDHNTLINNIEKIASIYSAMLQNLRK